MCTVSNSHKSFAISQMASEIFLIAFQITFGVFLAAFQTAFGTFFAVFQAAFPNSTTLFGISVIWCLHQSPIFFLFVQHHLQPLTRGNTTKCFGITQTKNFGISHTKILMNRAILRRAFFIRLMLWALLVL